MQPRHSPLLALALFALVACGGDDGPTGATTITRAQVAGIYAMTELRFDPQGSLPDQDIHARMDPTRLPELLLSRTGADAQLAFRDPESGVLRLVDATYTLLTDGVRLDLPATDTTGRSSCCPARCDSSWTRSRR